MPAFLMYPFLRTRDNLNSNTLLYYVKLLYVEDNPLRLAFNPQIFNVPVVMSKFWILLAAVVQLVVIIIHSSPTLMISQSYKFSHESLATL